MANFDELLKKIQNEEIKQTPKWQFDLMNISSIAFFLLFVVIGAISFSIILFSIQQTDFELLSHMGHSKLEAFLSILPFIWLVLLVAFVLGSIYALYKSKKGYKFTFTKLIGFSVGLSVLFGTMFFIGGGAGWFENAFALRAGFYESIQNKKEKIWQNPDKGNIAGYIQNTNGHIIELKDFDGKLWEIDIDTAFIPPSVFLEKGEKIKVSGKIISDNKFNAEGLYPWGGKGMRNKMRRKMKRQRQKKD